MRKSLLTCLFIFGCLSLFAQLEDDEFFWGFRAGATYSSIQDVSTTIIPPVFPEHSYTTETSPRPGFVGGLFFYYRFRNSRCAIQPEVTYSQEGSDFNYTDINGLEYTIAFKYQYLNFATLFKAYPVGGLHVAIGPQLGFNFENTNMDYTSNMPELGPDLQITQSLREVLKGETNLSVVLGVGYDFNFGLTVEGRYNLGAKDVIETLANGFNFIENKNKTTVYQLVLGWLIPFDQ
ncbi:MAG: hypothetical protein DHS20C18_20420 [Saprospiraceae bacterium]|nr:MAG: hypothetical protein DHS20C18_20420 [Saprospiraceae bacterium]